MTEPQPFLLGIDPGNSGALAFWQPSTRRLVIEDMPARSVQKGKLSRKIVDEHALLVLLRSQPVSHAHLELVHSMPKQGVASSFNFGVSLGLIRGMLAALNIPTTTISPVTWMRALGVSSAPDSARQRAMQLFPEFSHLFMLKKFDGRADAALLAHLMAVRNSLT